MSASARTLTPASWDSASWLIPAFNRKARNRCPKFLPEDVPSCTVDS
ncbi:hypothetical protein [Streptomyces eurythermus]